MLKRWILAVLYRLIAWVRWPYFYLSFLALVGLWWFVEITLEVQTKDDITMYDGIIVQFLNLMATPEVTGVAIGITDMGSGEVLTWLMIGAMAVCAWRKQYQSALLFLLTTEGGILLMTLAKGIFQRARPVVGSPLIQEVGHSYPSGHAMISLCFYGTLVLLFWLHGGRLLPKWIATIVLVILVGLIGLSRVYLGVHYPSDVLAGFCLGMFWLSLCGMIYMKRVRTVGENPPQPE